MHYKSQSANSPYPILATGAVRRAAAEQRQSVRGAVRRMVKPHPIRVLRHTAPLPPIRIGATERNPGLASPSRLLVIFMRVVAILWIGEGLAQWGILLIDVSGDALASASAQRLAAIGFFCVLDFIAGVGLWLTAPWGGVVWLVTLGGQLLTLVTLPGFWSFPVLITLVDVVLAVTYLGLALLASRETSQNG